MKKIDYKIELFDLLKDLTSINTQIVFEKEEDNIIVKRADSESTIAYKLSVSKDYFDFEDDQVAFYDYTNFYQYIKAFQNPELFIDQKNLVIKSNNSKVSYLLSNPESIPAGPKSINFTSPDIRFNLTSADLNELLQMIGLINAKKAQLIGNGEKITIKIFNSLHENSFEKEFTVENLTKSNVDIDFVMFSDTFANLPGKRNYVVEIKSAGFTKISLEDKNIQLDIFTGRVKS